MSICVMPPPRIWTTATILLSFRVNWWSPPSVLTRVSAASCPPARRLRKPEGFGVLSVLCGKRKAISTEERDCPQTDRPKIELCGMLGAMAEKLASTHERVDDIPLLIGLTQRLHFPEILGRRLDDHGYHQGLSNGGWRPFGWPASCRKATTASPVSRTGLGGTAGLWNA